MQTVEAADGTTYVLEKRSGESSRVRDPRTGETTTLPNDSLDFSATDDPLEAAADAVDADVRAVLAAAGNDRALGLLVTLHHQGPTGVRRLLDETTCCESDLLGLVTGLRAAGLLTPADTETGEGYALTEQGERGVENLLAVDGER
ncbi:DUF7346 family protein [Halocalculus aciditolerans]|uniref:Uncharacterized protein n=1 Tax=Halocalculus aciditolerans TaxID=1383812 RepID=A0A830FJC2_9EURY|nr:hypothetical protein [Halocalculus aciditolerans]GGL61856.1 hypothetical protein GCM10009039_20070 [Halocalculus aciditolerans]